MRLPSCAARRPTSISAHAVCATLLAAAACAPARADSLSAARAVTPAGVEVCGFGVANGGRRSALLYTTGSTCGEVDSIRVRLGRGRDLARATTIERRPARTGSQRLQIFRAPQIAVGPDGRAVAAWIARGRQAGRDQLRVAIAAPGHGFGAARTLASRRLRRGSVPEIELSGVIAGRDGRIVVSWTAGQRPRGVLRAAVAPRGGRFGRSQTLGPIWLLSTYARAPRALAVSPSGIVVAAWTPSDRHSAAAATLAHGHRRFGRAREVSGQDDAMQVQAVGGPGGAGVSWQAATADGSRILLRLALLRRDARLAPPATIATADTPATRGLEVNGPQVAFTLATRFVAWQVFRDISEAGDGRVDSTSVQAATARPSAPAGPAAVLSTGATGEPVIGALSDRALVAWSESPMPGHARLRLAVSRTGIWAPARTLSESSGPVMIAASTHNAVIAWQPSTQTERRVMLAIYYR